MAKVLDYSERSETAGGSRCQLVNARVAITGNDGEPDQALVQMVSISGCALHGYSSCLESLDEWFIRSFEGVRLIPPLRLSEADGLEREVAEAVMAHRRTIW